MNTMSENKRSILLEIHGQLDDEIANFMHNLEEDDTVTEKTWRMCESRYTRLSRILRELYEEVNYS